MYTYRVITLLAYSSAKVLEVFDNELIIYSEVNRATNERNSQAVSRAPSTSVNDKRESYCSGCSQYPWCIKSIKGIRIIAEANV